MVVPRVSVAARLLPGGDTVVAAAAAILRLGVELLMRGARLERVGGGEMATFRFQVGTHLSTNRWLASKKEKVATWGDIDLLNYRLTDSLRLLWDRCRKVAADCPVWASRSSPCPHDHSHSSNLS